MKRKLVHALVCILICIAGKLYAQEELNEPVSGEIISSSPEASTLGQYGDIPFDYHTGRVTYSIPFYTINVGEVSLPISLTYSSSGLKVAEVPTRAGLGWTLNAGGVISSTVRGKADFGTNGLQQSTPINDDVKAYLDGTLSESDIATLLDYSQKGLWDTEPDVFHYNTGSMNGKFMFDVDGVIHHLPHNRLNINRINENSWEIEDRNGTKYLFDKPESTSSEYGERFTTAVKTAWYLSEITLANEVDKITFSYVPQSQVMPEYKSETNMRGLGNGNGNDCSGAGGYVSTIGQQSSVGHKLTKITFPGGEINFNDGAAREDHGGGSTLGSIVLSTDEGVLKTFNMSYEYFGGSTALENKRLKLKSIEEVGKGTTTLDYFNEYTSNFPSWNIDNSSYYHQDHWGYYNSNANAHFKTLIPENFYYPNGAERSPDWTKSVYGMLKTIHYPTGGETNFEYEGNIVPRRLLPPSAGGADIGLPCDLDFDVPGVTTISILNDETNGHYIQQDFTLSQGQCIQIDYELFAKDLAASGEGSSEMKLLRGSSSIFHEAITSTPAGVSKSDVIELSLEAGTYTIYTFVEKGGHVDCHADIQLKYFGDNVSSIPLKVGGVRVKKITSCPETVTNCTSKVFSYIEEDLQVYRTGVPLSNEVNTSTGRLLNYPVYSYYSFTPAPFGVCPSIAFSSQSQLQNSSEHVAYDKVTIYEGEFAENGKTVIEYKNRIDDIDFSFPFAPSTDYSFRRGLQTKKQIYKKLNDEFKLIQSEETEYHFGELGQSNNNPVFGLKVGYGYLLNPGIGNGSLITHVKFVVDEYYSHAAWDYVTSTTTKLVDASENEVITTTNYEYNNPLHFQPTRIEKTTSGSDKIVEIMKYPDDYTGLAGNFIQQMALDERYHMPVESQVWIDKNGILKFAGSNYIVYDKIKNGFYPSEFWRSNNATLATDYQNSYNIANPLPDPRMEKRVTYSFDDFGKLLSRQKNSGLITAYVYGYGDLRLPIAEVVNAAFDEVFVENFEAATSNITTNAHTGQQAYNGGNYTIPFSPDTNEKPYVMDYWLYENGNWKLYQRQPFQSVISTGGAALDNVRVYPKNAFISSYTYDPLVGITSTLDQNGILSKYVYDNLGRLEQVLDQDGNTIQQSEYNYGN